MDPRKMMEFTDQVCADVSLRLHLLEDPVATLRQHGFSSEDAAALAGFDWGAHAIQAMLKAAGSRPDWGIGSSDRPREEFISGFEVTIAPGRQADFHAWCERLWDVTRMVRRRAPAAVGVFGDGAFAYPEPSPPDDRAWGATRTLERRSAAAGGDYAAVSMLVMQSLRYPARFRVGGVFWFEDKAREFALSEVYRQVVGEAAAAGVVGDFRGTEMFRVHSETSLDDSIFNRPAGATTANPYVLHTIWTLRDLGVDARAFLDRETSRLELMRSAALDQPMLGAMLREARGNPLQYHSFMVFNDAAHARAVAAHPLVRQFEAGHPLSDYTDAAPSFEAMEIIHRYVP